MLMSATSSEEVDRLTQLVLHNPVTLNLLGRATAEGNEVRREQLFVLFFVGERGKGVCKGVCNARCIGK